MVLANVGIMAFTAHSAAKVPSYVRWRRVVVIPASLLSTIGTATTFRGTEQCLASQQSKCGIHALSIWRTRHERYNVLP